MGNSRNLAIELIPILTNILANVTFKTLVVIIIKISKNIRTEIFSTISHSFANNYTFHSFVYVSNLRRSCDPSCFELSPLLCNRAPIIASLPLGEKQKYYF